MVRRHDSESLEYQTRVKRIVGGVGFSNGCRLRSIASARKRWVRFLPINSMRNNRPASDFGSCRAPAPLALSWTMDKLGPICRAWRHGIVLSAIHGPDGTTARTQPQRSTGTPTSTGGKLRLGYLKADFEQQPPPQQTSRGERRKRTL